MPSFLRFACQFPGCNAVIYLADIKTHTHDCAFTLTDNVRYNPFQCFFKSTLYGMVLHVTHATPKS